jgi:hypothetical protein
MPAEALRLEVASIADQNHWRWVLKEANGAFLADHELALDPAEPKYRALFDLPGYLHHFAAPDKREVDERRLLDEIGAWIGATVLGGGIAEKIVAGRAPPTIVRVLVPPEAERLLVLPLEIAHVIARLRRARISPSRYATSPSRWRGNSQGSPWCT